MKRDVTSFDPKYLKRIEKKAKAMIPAKAFLFKQACFLAISIMEKAFSQIAGLTSLQGLFKAIISP